MDNEMASEDHDQNIEEEGTDHTKCSEVIADESEQELSELANTDNKGAQVVLHASENDHETFRRRSLSREYIETEIRIIVIGKTGVGKSATANTIVGEEYFQSSRGALSVTKKCAKKHAQVYGRNLLVVDTPGIFDTETNPNILQNEIKKCIKIGAPGPHAILFVISLTVRFTEEDNHALTTFLSYFGKEMLDHVTIVFTFADILEDHKTTLEKFLENSPRKLKELVNYCGGRIIAFNNNLKKEERKPQVMKLIENIESLTSEKLHRSYYFDKKFEDAELEMQRREREIEGKLRQEFSEKTKKFEENFAEEYEKKLQNIQFEFKKEVSDLRKKVRDQSDIIQSINQTPETKSDTDDEMVNEPQAIVHQLKGTKSEISKGEL